MRLPLVPIVFVLSVASGIAGITIGTAASAAPAPKAPETHVTVVRPVTGDGEAASGYGLKLQLGGAIDCSSADPSPGAVDANIEQCSPSAAYAVACWKSTTAHHALCLRNPMSKVLHSITYTGAFAKTPIAKPNSQAPLLLVLSDGTRCSIRDGGAASSLKSHPQWVVTYYCDKHGAVWSSPKVKHYGVNESKDSWTVRTASASGAGKLTVRHVKHAYFVGTDG